MAPSNLGMCVCLQYCVPLMCGSSYSYPLLVCEMCHISINNGVWSESCKCICNQIHMMLQTAFQKDFKFFQNRYSVVVKISPWLLYTEQHRDLLSNTMLIYDLWIFIKKIPLLSEWIFKESNKLPNCKLFYIILWLRGCGPPDVIGLHLPPFSRSIANSEGWQEL